MTSVGQILRTQRKSRGLDVTRIAEELCITSSYVRSIEKDDFKSLPNVFFYKSFVKQYAAFLGVDQELLRTGVEALVAPEEPASGEHKPARSGVAWRLHQRMHA